MKFVPYNSTEVDLAKLTWVLRNRTEANNKKYEAFLKLRRSDFFNPEFFNHREVVLEIGAGTGWMLLKLAQKNPETFYIGIERDRMRGNRLEQRAEKTGLKNLAAIRGNVIPSLTHGVPDASLDRIYIMYPAPFPKSSHRKKRWYVHPAMPHLVRALKPGGLIIWASDQEYYINEAEAICRKFYPLNVLSHGTLKPNAYNHLEEFPAGRTKFENHFLSSGLPCYELIVQKATAGAVSLPL